MSTPVTAYVCLAYDNGYLCNREPRHQGDHEAWAACPSEGVDRYVAHRWPNTPQEEK